MTAVVIWIPLYMSQTHHTVKQITRDWLCHCFVFTKMPLTLKWDMGISST